MTRKLKRVAAGAVVAAASGAAIAVGGVHLVAADAATATTGVNIRSGPGTSYAIVGGLEQGQSITAIGQPSNGWVKVSFDGGTAYVSAQYLDLAGQVDTSTPVTIYTQGNKVASATLNVRNGPSLTSQVIGYISDGEQVTLTGKQSRGFAEVLYGGERAWVSSEYLISSVNGLPTATGTEVATADLFIRTTDDSSFKIITTVPAGTTLKVTGATSNGFAQVIFDNAIRWVTAQYLSSTAKAGPVPETSATTNATPASAITLPRVIGTRYATTELLVRTTARDNTGIGSVLRGHRVMITGAVSNGKAQIVDDGAVRWVTAEYLSTTKPLSGSAVARRSSRPRRSTRPSRPAPSPSTSFGGVASGFHGASRNVSDSVWDQLAMCESSGDWSIDTGNGFYGGLQFTLQTWHGFGGTGLPNHATPAQQIEVAERVLAAQGWAAWPACSTKLGLR